MARRKRARSHRALRRTRHLRTFTLNPTPYTQPMTPQDKIFIKDLLLRGIIGINDWEREKQQDILINMTLFTDLSAAGKSDDIGDTLNYRTIAKQVIQYVEEGSAHYT